MEKKQRHGCVTVWLALMIILNSLTAIIYLLSRNFSDEILSEDLSTTNMIFLAMLGIANIIFSVMIFKWKIWGFYGFVITSIVAMTINLSIGLSILQSLFGLIGILALYGVLQIKVDNVSAWNNLE